MAEMVMEKQLRVCVHTGSREREPRGLTGALGTPKLTPVSHGSTEATPPTPEPHPLHRGHTSQRVPPLSDQTWMSLWGPFLFKPSQAVSTPSLQKMVYALNGPLSSFLTCTHSPHTTHTFKSKGGGSHMRENSRAYLCEPGLHHLT